MAFIPAAAEFDALLALAIVTLVIVALVAFETIRYSELRARMKAELA